jgi:hypothetical protein
MSKRIKYNTKEIGHVVDNITSISKDLIPVGGWRRNSPIVHDVDFISLLSFDELLPKLEVLKDNVVKLPHNIKNNRRKIKFDYKLDNDRTIQIDIFYVKKEEYPFALLHFTGNYLFNIYARTIAIKKGYKLNQYGLFLLQNNKVNDSKSEDQIKKEKEQLNNINSERNIFDFLNLEWKEPSERDIGESDHIHWKKMTTSITGGKKRKTKKTTKKGGECGCNKKEGGKIVRTTGGKSKSKSTKTKVHKRSTMDPPPINNHKKPLNTLPEESVLKDEDKSAAVENDIMNDVDDDEEEHIEGGRRRTRKRKSGGILGGLGKIISRIFGGNFSDDDTMPEDKTNDLYQINPTLGGMDSRELQLRGMKPRSKKSSRSKSSKSGGKKSKTSKTSKSKKTKSKSK